TVVSRRAAAEAGEEGGKEVGEEGGEGEDRWVVFEDRQGLGEEVSRRLREAGKQVAVVRQGGRLESSRPGSGRPASGRVESGRVKEYRVDEGRPGDYERVIRELVAEGRMGKEIVYLWGIGEEEEASDWQGFERMVKLAQGLGGELKSGEVRINVVSEKMQEVSGEEEIEPGKATVQGVCKVIGQENAKLRCRSIDVRVGEEGSEQRRQVVEQVVGELLSDSSDLVVAYRGHYRSVQTFEPVRGKTGKGKGKDGGLRQGGVYLITGGLGQIGLALAEYLAGAVGARLVLTGRAALPPRQEWANWLATHAAGDAVSRKLGRLLKIEERGGEVLTLAADVSDAQRMGEVIEEIQRRYGQLNGVIHAAGIVGRESQCAIQESGRQAYEKQARAKVRGVEVLGEVLRGEEVDFCMLMSSLAAVLGGLGFGVYAGVNAYMDSYASRENRRGKTRWVSVNWDG
ncbi:MAG TPA: SDR family NAD(P)-dependent oxidoreductase, partial [Gemmatimonadales bacterium]|nr:SDR family NAD(P)-dependent oxidoreductase [Gemmatimonadales bacterium]